MVLGAGVSTDALRPVLEVNFCALPHLRTSLLTQGTVLLLANSKTLPRSDLELVLGAGVEPAKAQGRQIYSLLRLTTSLSQRVFGAGRGI